MKDKVKFEKLVEYLNKVIGSNSNCIMSQRELADQLGVTNVLVWKWLKKDINIKLEYAIKICNILKLDEKKYLGEYYLSIIKIPELEEKYSKLSEENQSKALDYIDYLLTKNNESKPKKTSKKKEETEEIVLKEYSKLDFSPTRLMRIAKNLSIHELAALLNLSPSYVYSIENGDRRISKNYLTAMLSTFNIEYTEYVKLEKYINKVLKQDIDEKDKYSKALLKALTTIEPELGHKQNNKEKIKD